MLVEVLCALISKAAKLASTLSNFKLTNRQRLDSNPIVAAIRPILRRTASYYQSIGNRIKV
jgi:hypothetical protein